MTNRPARLDGLDISYSSGGVNRHQRIASSELPIWFGVILVSECQSGTLFSAACLIPRYFRSMCCSLILVFVRLFCSGSRFHLYEDSTKSSRTILFFRGPCCPPPRRQRAWLSLCHRSRGKIALSRRSCLVCIVGRLLGAG